MIRRGISLKFFDTQPVFDLLRCIFLPFRNSKKHFNRKVFIFFLFVEVFGLSALHAQKIQLQGKVQDTLAQPVFGANLIATPTENSHETVFSITDAQGRYKLHLDSGVTYGIQIVSLGFETQTDSVNSVSDMHKNYTMEPSVTALQEVVIQAKLAVIVKEDTITYKVDKFRAGDERKLRDLLKKLPGVEVDRKGNVTVNGKKVTQLMVDGKSFFGGDTQLGVNNIPADVVDEVEAIEDYREVAFMKGLRKSDRVALNIKLKKGKKHFIFGETQVGSNAQKRYLVHPTLFYYSPKTTLNFIGSLNNVNQSPLDFKDVMRFRDGAMRFADTPINSGDAGLYRFSSSNDIQTKKMLFGAINLTQQFNSKLRLSGYSIVAKQKSKSLETNQIHYFTQDNLKEYRKKTTQNESFINFNKLKLRYKPNLHTDIAYHLIVQTAYGNGKQNLYSRFVDSLNQTRVHESPYNFELKQFFRWNSQPTYKHTSEIKANYSYKVKRSLTHWQFDRPVFSTIIPDIPDGKWFNFYDDFSETTNTRRFNFKHYWVLNNTNHIYPKVGLYFFHQKYNSINYQKLQNGNTNTFTAAGFDNALHYQLIDPYIGFQYKFKLGDIIFRPGLVYHQYLWQVDQYGERIAGKSKGLFLPEFYAEYEIVTGKKIEFDYHLKTSFADASDYANRLRLVGFNHLYRGNETLENALFHNFQLKFHSSSTFTRMNYFVQLGYLRYEKSTRNQTILEGINQISTSIYSQLPESRYRFNGYMSKRWDQLRLNLGVSSAFSDYSRIINDEKMAYKTQYFSYNLGFSSTFEKWPNWTLGIQQNFRNLKMKSIENKYRSMTPFIALDYAFLNGFILKADYEYSHSNNLALDSQNTYQLADASLFYRKENSPWGFEVKVNNLFDVHYKQRHSINEFRVFNERIYIRPQTFLFVLSYQL